MNKKNIGAKKVMPFVIPSGIVITELSCLERISEIPEIGILTTKSIGIEPWAGYDEPVLAQYAPGEFINAVGLRNPGAEEFAKKLSLINLPEDKFLLASIFGKNASEFVSVAKMLSKYVDGFELNLSCPHAKGYGMQIGQDSEMVYEITRAIVQSSEKPVFTKLTPNVKDIGEIAKAAVSAGAYGVTAINTVGPKDYFVDGFSVLTNILGGCSGKGIMQTGIKCIQKIRQAVGEKAVIIGMGGIRTAQDVKDYICAGADFFGVGSALAGMNEAEIKMYFSMLAEDLIKRSNHAENLLQNVNMGYRKVKIEEKLNINCDFKIFRTDSKIDAQIGQFVFAWLPEIGEKPFSVMDNSPLTLGILERGKFTKSFNLLEKGSSFYIRGPYGRAPQIANEEEVVLVGGGCGIAGLYLFAKNLSRTNKIITFLGAKDKHHLAFGEEFKNFGEVHIATEDGSLGRKGPITDLLNESKLKQNCYFINCGPKQMVDAVLPIELEVSNPEKVYSSVDYLTRCGVGICGSCADKKGRRTCVEGPFLSDF